MGCTAAPVDGQDAHSASEDVASNCARYLPDPAITPGRVCSQSDPNFSGYRYPGHVAVCARSVSSAEKDSIAARYGVARGEYSQYEFDHFIPLSIGGSDAVENVWPQPLAEAHEKDALEQELYNAISQGTITQADAVSRVRAWRPSNFPASCAPPVDGGVVHHPEAGTHDAAADAATTGSDAGAHPKPTVFVIVMENHNWSSIKGSASAPYLNGTLLPQASYAENYTNPRGNHPSEPNYIWLEAGSSLGVHNDSAPTANHQSTTAHLSTLLDAANVSWRSYQEDIDGRTCPLIPVRKYAPKHNPFVFFDDQTNTNDSTYAPCIAHNRPYAELASDLATDSVARYNFITPNLCNDMHDSTGCGTNDSVKNGDSWLATEVPKILASASYQRGGALFITWDESEGGDFPIGMIVLSPKAKGHGYSNHATYTHSSLLRTLQELMNVTPLLGDAAHATNLSELFDVYP